MKKRIKIPSDLRKLVKELYGKQCKYCSENDRKLLHIHHIDENPSNNNIENLELLCVFCHMAQHPGNEENMIEWMIKKGNL